MVVVVDEGKATLRMKMDHKWWFGGVLMGARLWRYDSVPKPCNCVVSQGAISHKGHVRQEGTVLHPMPTLHRRNEDYNMFDLIVSPA